MDDYTDLIRRLRDLAPTASLTQADGNEVCHAAADAIERLQAELRNFENCALISRLVLGRVD